MTNVQSGDITTVTRSESWMSDQCAVKRCSNLVSLVVSVGTRNTIIQCLKGFMQLAMGAPVPL